MRFVVLPLGLPRGRFTGREPESLEGFAGVCIVVGSAFQCLRRIESGEGIVIRSEAASDVVDALGCSALAETEGGELLGCERLVTSKGDLTHQGITKPILLKPIGPGVLNSGCMMLVCQPQGLGRLCCARETDDGRTVHKQSCIAGELDVEGIEV